LVAAVLALTVAVLGLGGAVLVIKLKPQPTPTTVVDRNLVSWKEAVDADPEDDVARTAYGLALLDAGRADDAQGEFQQAIELNGKNWVALLQLGLLTKATDPQGALQLIGKSARYAPASSKAVPFIAQGDLLFKTGDMERAKAAYRNAIADVPYVFEGHVGLAKTYEALGDPKHALKEYQQAARYVQDDQAVADAIARLQGNG
jgi:tetratricopeptide (TPR) repeat protein